MADASGKYQAYNLNPNPVTVNGVTYQPAQCGTSLCDPRGIGLNPVIQKIWNYMPMPTDFTGAAGDGANVGGYISTVRAPLTQNSYVARIDHDFNEKNRFFATYRYSTVTSLTTNQVDIGGLVGGGTLGQPVATAPRVQKPTFWVLGLTSADHAHHHQRFPLELLAQLLAVVPHRRKCAAVAGPRPAPWKSPVKAPTR